MSRAGELKQMATDIARSLQNRVSALQKELEKIKAREVEIETQLNFARSVPDRLFNYQPELESGPQCPSCWIKHENRAPLYPIGGGTSTHDFFRCTVCNEKFEIAFR
jgi:hypothetical protein